MFRKLKFLLPARRAYRSLRNEFNYLAYQHKRPDSDVCNLCNLTDYNNTVVADSDDWVIINNKFPYSKWDWQPVRDHLMLVPKRHLVRLDEVYKKEWKTFGEIVSQYDNGGYSIYLRSQKNPVKTVAHLHWHLIKVD